MARRIQRWYRFGRGSMVENDRRLVQRCITTIANLNWKHFGNGFYSGSDENGYVADVESICFNLCDDYTPEDNKNDMKYWWDDFNIPSTLARFEETWNSKEDSFWEYLDGFEQRHYSISK